MFACVCVLVAQLCLTLCDPMGCSPPGSSVHGILQAGILEWVAAPFSRGSSRPGIEPRSPALAGRFFNAEPLGKPMQSPKGFCASATMGKPWRQWAKGMRVRSNERGAICFFYEWHGPPVAPCSARLWALPVQMEMSSLELEESDWCWKNSLEYWASVNI